MKETCCALSTSLFYSYISLDQRRKEASRIPINTEVNKITYFIVKESAAYNTEAMYR